MQSVFSLKGFSLEKCTDKEKVVSLIEKLHPLQTDKELIRLGPVGDGGYLVPNDLEGIEACFSPGVGLLSVFEEDCAKRNMEVFMADKSVAGPAVQNEKFHFIKRFIGPITNEDFITMDDWVNESPVSKDSDLLLQMDIENHEYFSIMNMSSSLLKRCRIIVIEFHQVHKLWNREFFNVASTVFERLLQNHICVHNHPNNARDLYVREGVEIPSLIELTFIRKDRVKTQSPQTQFPHPLDSDCTSRPTVVLPKNWHK